ncbi:DUF6887 family protein [Kamptonema formosum]|uniref:DUF6887 family protein n=1 Tax=Kamptonema formosum TaxID=331992 RepID=UPI000345EFEB|nr:hypothetical protein [Oscillatoria sp. PCC 10802]
MKPNFEQMSVPELRAYVLEHRDDIEAIRALFHHPSLKWKTMPPLFTPEGARRKYQPSRVSPPPANRIRQGKTKRKVTSPRQKAALTLSEPVLAAVTPIGNTGILPVLPKSRLPSPNPALHPL